MNPNPNPTIVIHKRSGQILFDDWCLQLGARTRTIAPERLSFTDIAKVAEGLLAEGEDAPPQLLITGTLGTNSLEDTAFWVRELRRMRPNLRVALATNLLRDPDDVDRKVFNYVVDELSEKYEGSICGIVNTFLRWSQKKERERAKAKA